MSKLVTVHDFTPMAAISAALLNQATPSGGSFVLGPFNSLFYEHVPTHTTLWTVRPENLPFPRNIENYWLEISKNLDAGKNVLLHTPTRSIQAHNFFREQFIKRVDSNKHSLESIFIIGKPLLLFELLFRKPAHLTKNGELDGQISRLLQIPELIRSHIVHLGQQNVSLIANLTDSAVGKPDPDILGSLMAKLSMTMPANLPKTIANPSFRSMLVRRLRNALEVRDNAWPEINQVLLENALHDTDDDLPEDICSPLELRRGFAAKAENAIIELEELVNQPQGSLTGPEYLLSAEKTEPVKEFPQELVSRFRQSLGADAENKLIQRLRNDKVILTKDQLELLGSLAGKQTFAAIGEPEPPLELTVLTMAYNHEKYIAQCMDSVLAQKTDFPVRHLVLDHHSEDGTAEIIREYARKHPSIQPVLLSHRRRNENVYGLFDRCRSRYAALCDGDDFFTDPCKLRKQVDFLEQNPDYSLCFHPVMAVFEDGRKPVIFPPLDTLPQRKNGQIYLTDLIQTNFIQTNSAVYRWRFTKGLPAWFNTGLCPGDWYWHLLHAETGNIGFIPEIMSAYRRHSGALYAQAITDRTAHRQNLGMAELNTYEVLDSHFRRRYHKFLSTLASGVFADFVEIMIKKDDSRLFDRAVEKYPDFARDFLNSLPTLAKESTKS